MAEVADMQGQDRIIEATPAATSKIRELRDRENLGDKGLRVRVVGGGCHGFSYALGFDERKEGDPATCLEILKRKGLMDRVVVQAFDWDYLAGCRALDQGLALGALGDKECTAEKLDRVARTGASVVGWENKYTTADTIRQIHDRGYKAWVWTVDDPQRAIELVGAKVDGIITNRPAEIRAAIQAAAQAR